MHDFWRELERDVIRPNFQGQITLHVQQGVVRQYEVNERRKPSNGFADIQEDNNRDLTE